MKRFERDQNHFDSVARVVAGENLSIRHGKFRTAFIDLKSRKIYLPEWSKLDTDISEHLRAHEVAHAMFTPLDLTHDAIKESSHKKLMKDCLNIIEDGRIESKMQMMFPGYRKIFSRSYKKLWDQNFFGTTDINKIAKMLFIDRLNVLLKTSSSNARILLKSKEEFALYHDVLRAETFEEVIALAKRLMDMTVLEKKHNNTEQQFEQDQPESGEENEEQVDCSGESLSDEEESDESESEEGEAKTTTNDDESEESEESSEGEESEESSEGESSESESEESSEGESSESESEESSEGEESEESSEGEESEESSEDESSESESEESSDDGDDDFGSQTLDAFEDAIENMMDENASEEAKELNRSTEEVINSVCHPVILPSFDREELSVLITPTDDLLADADEFLQGFMEEASDYNITIDKMNPETGRPEGILRKY